MLPELFIESGTMRWSSYASIWEASSTQYLVQLLHFNIYLFVISQQQLPNHCSFICCFFCTPNCYCDCSGVSANFAAPAIWDATTAFLAASFVGLATGLWRGICKEQRPPPSRSLVPQLFLQEICEKLSVKSSVSCPRILWFCCWFHYRSVKSCSTISGVSVLKSCSLMSGVCVLGNLGYPRSPMCHGYPSFPMCPGYPSSLMYSESSGSAASTTGGWRAVCNEQLLPSLIPDPFIDLLVSHSCLEDYRSRPSRFSWSLFHLESLVYIGILSARYLGCLCRKNQLKNMELLYVLEVLAALYLGCPCQ